MEAKVLFFSQLKELAATSELAVELPNGATVADLLTQLYQRFPRLRKWDRNLLVGIGVDFVGRDRMIQPNDLIAIMPPVQGG